MKTTAAALAIAVLSISPQRAAKLERAVPFKVGETLTYDVSWSSSLTAATAVSTVKDKIVSGGSAAYFIVAEGRPLPILAKLYTLYYRAETLLDAYTLLSQRGTFYSEEGGRKRSRSTEFDRKTQPSAQDSVAALYVLRSASFKVGDHLSMPVIDNGITYQVRFDIGAPETVRGPTGPINAWRVRVLAENEKKQPAGHNMAIWISTDQRRLPVKLQADLPVGTFGFTLREVREPGSR